MRYIKLFFVCLDLGVDIEVVDNLEGIDLMRGGCGEGGYSFCFGVGEFNIVLFTVDGLLLILFKFVFLIRGVFVY